jgi:outer membrane protein assembly factor BamB
LPNDEEPVHFYQESQALIRSVFALATVISLWNSTTVQGENWPEFRGPTGQGIATSTDLPIEWSPTKNVVWKQAIPGKGWSSPIVYEGRIYLTTSVPNSANKDQSLRALCLDAKTGKVLWDQEVFRQEAAKAPRIHAKNSHASPTPLTDGQRLYVHFGHQGTACLDLTGKVLWRNTSVSYEPVHGNGGSPILVDNALVFSGDGFDQQFIVALDRNTGQALWKVDRQTDAFKKFSFGTPLLITVEGQKQIISPGSDMVGAYDPRTGKEIWRVNYGGYSIIPRPVYGHGLVFICTGFDQPRLLAIRPDGQGDVTAMHVAWTSRAAVPLSPSLLLVGDELYMVADGGLASCVDAKTGRKHWQERLGGNYSASPLFADGKIYFQSEEGVGTVLKAEKKFQLLAKNSLGERTLASYAVADHALFIRTEQHLYRIQKR